MVVGEEGGGRAGGGGGGNRSCRVRSTVKVTHIPLILVNMTPHATSCHAQADATIRLYKTNTESELKA